LPCVAYDVRHELILSQPKKEYYGEEKHEESYSAPKKEYYKEEKHEESYEVSLDTPALPAKNYPGGITTEMYELGGKLS
jgi:hypothetical protein